MVLAAAYVALIWAPDRSVEELAGRWAPPPSSFVELEGMRVHLRDEGPRQDPVPIVLLHGTSASLHTWDGWAAVLSQRRRVIRLDLPGFGLTGPFPDNNYTVEHYVTFLGELLARLSLERVVLAGNSFGGRIAWRVALADPDRVDSLILIDAAGYPSTASSIPLGFRLARTPGVRHLMEHVLPRSVVEKSIRNVYGDPSKVTPELVDRYYELTLRAGNRAALRERFVQAANGPDAARIREVTRPALLIWGALDRLIPADHAERFRADLPSSEVIIFPDLGHVPQEEDPARTVAAAERFLEARRDDR